ncbi:hypothetical protein KF728_28220 [Candidatus Obscuribacterales bacterium]|nr:hypothetical protein [Candidatus Obscuribacterales bacterium]MBX3154074.1 hypothetical protein [Candidatus Obscuribacterales bacterium]
MSRLSSRHIQIKCLESDAFGLFSVVANPRSVTPYDVKRAGENVGLEFDGKKPARDVVSLVNYVLSGYFEMAHRTGLYNRQRELWESISRLTSCKVEVVRQGFLVPIRIPVFDIVFYNSQNSPLVIARLVKPQKRKDFDKRASRYLSSFITKVNKLQTKKGTLTGAIICVPSPAPAAVIQKIQQKVGANDPVNRFDSRLPQSGISLNLAAMDYGGVGVESGQYAPLGSNSSLSERNGDSEDSASTNLRLIYPEADLFPVTLVHPELSKK